ncbi:unnamed protein product [Periconia digitata]|uniref:mRNA N(6)-methyladenine demethylase n=1 Tax=Periconia digitata TaxID=1303443 RepID=A0A9W4XNQ2_9PLEO|nr:unnamed protein product [Periconia digitata]
MDPYQRPPDGIRTVYKKYQKMKPSQLDLDVDIVDLLPSDLDLDRNAKVRVVNELDAARLTASFGAFAGGDVHASSVRGGSVQGKLAVYEHQDMPGLHIIPSLLPSEIQPILLSKLLHRDLSHPLHLTNIHTHYNVAYPPGNASFFSLSPTSPDAVAHPLDPSVHRPLNAAQLLNKKMRWVTLGGQYDWTQKKYPDASPPPFPSDIGQLLNGVFSDTKAEAAIVNLYSPGDTLSVHRDVAESSATGLISVSLGCDAIFVIGTTSPSGTSAGGDTVEEKVIVLRLRSGSAVYMSGSSRFAWHGVPQIVPGTCPDALKSWPAAANSQEVDEYENWRGWMEGKRVNLNVRQMWD